MKRHFGTVALARPVFFSDLDKTEEDLLRAGNFQILPTRDSVGRRVVVRLGDLGGADVTLFNKTRIYLYMLQVPMEDEQTQRLGHVMILGPQNHQSNPYSHDKRRIVQEITENTPTNCTAFHILLPSSPVFQALKGLALLVAGKKVRARARFHERTPMEWFYSIASYGINKEILPITSSGNIKTKQHAKWIALRQAKEKAMMESRSFDGIECPNSSDIFFRRGGNLNSHMGNKMLREIELSKYEYYRTRRTQEEKTKLPWCVVEEVERRGGRFLVECSGGYWVQLKDRNAAREKISNAFRDIRKTPFGEKIMQTTNSSTTRFLNQDHSYLRGNKRQSPPELALDSLARKKLHPP